MGIFWNAVVKPGGKPTPYVPSGDAEGFILHISQASLPPTIPEGKRVAVQLKQGPEDEQPAIICTLVAGKQDTVPLDLFLDGYVEFTILGHAAEVHLTGYLSPHEEAMGSAGGDEEDEDEDYVGEDEDGDLQLLPPGMLDGEDFDSDDMMDEDEVDEDEDEDDEPGVTRRPHVVIEEIPDEDKAVAVKKSDGKKGDKQSKAAAAQAAANKKRAAPESKEEDESEEDEPAKKHKASEQSKQQKQQQQQQQQQTPKQQKAAAAANGHTTAVATPATANKTAQQTPAAKIADKKEQQQQTPGTAVKASEVKTGKKNVRRWENGFEIEDVSTGPPNGKLAKAGKRVQVKYIGRLKHNGKVFDQSKGKPFTFRLGVGEVIKGWDRGVEGMRVGDKRRLVIPPQLAYGSTGVQGAIPPNAMLEFDVELVDVK